MHITNLMVDEATNVLWRAGLLPFDSQSNADKEIVRQMLRAALSCPDESGAIVRNLTDRELLVGIFNAVCALAEKLTGEKLVVFLPSAAGYSPYSGVSCAWLPKDDSAH